MRLRQSLPRSTQAESTSARSQPTDCGRVTAMESFREDRATANAAILGRRDVSDRSFEENLRHHALVFVIKEMAVKDGHAPDDGVGEIHNDVDGTAVRNIYGV